MCRPRGFRNVVAVAAMQGWDGTWTVTMDNGSPILNLRAEKMRNAALKALDGAMLFGPGGPVWLLIRLGIVAARNEAMNRKTEKRFTMAAKIVKVGSRKLRLAPADGSEGDLVLVRQ